MRVGAFLLVTLTLFGAAAAQERGKWVRVYTFDDAVIEMEEIDLSFGNFGRVRFRTVFREPRPMPGKADLLFKTVVEDMEIQCRERQYRLSTAVYLNSKGSPVYVYKADGDEEWEEVRTHMMLKLIDPACRMIEKKKM